MSEPYAMTFDASRFARSMQEIRDVEAKGSAEKRRIPPGGSASRAVARRDVSPDEKCKTRFTRFTRAGAGHEELRAARKRSTANGSPSRSAACSVGERRAFVGVDQKTTALMCRVRAARGLVNLAAHSVNLACAELTSRRGKPRPESKPIEESR